MDARLRVRKRIILRGGFLVEMVAWDLPRASPDRPHAIKYRLYCGRKGQSLVRYDNETGKGDHVHHGTVEKPYRFVSWEKLLDDFLADVERLTGEADEKD